MIAFLTSDMKTGLAIMQVNFPSAKIDRAKGFVYFNPAEGAPPSGIIASDDRTLRGRELSGYVLLTDDVPARLKEAAFIMACKPFYWHVRAHEERSQP